MKREKSYIKKAIPQSEKAKAYKREKAYKKHIEEAQAFFRNGSKGAQA